MGDFYQLLTVGTKPLYVAALEASPRDNQYDAHLFQQSRLFEFTQHTRAAECSIRRSLADCFRTSELPFRCEHLRYLEQLSASNIRNDPSWLDAIIVTPGNHVHCAVNKDRVTRLAPHLVPALI